VSAERARLFVALELPLSAREALVRWRSSHLRGVAGVRLVEPGALHVTLCFLGWRAVGEIDPIGAACASVATLPDVELSLGTPVWLPARRPRVLAVELGDPRAGLREIQGTLSRALRAGGFYEPQTRPFFAHVTVARIGRNERVRRVELPAPSPLTLRGSVITLYRSRLSAGGAGYEPLHRVRLGAG
jgi:RNA 2',3'-cyclic 3'-phosphodiesterase